MGALNKDGYGNTIMPRPARKNMYAHRRSWEMVNGPIPEGMHCLHRCDTPACVNPAHLFLGTQADNMQDKSRKGRAVGQYKLADVLAARSAIGESSK